MEETKTTYRIALEQFEFVEVVEESPPSKERYDELKAEFRSKTGKGMPDKQFNELFDLYTWKNEGISTEEWAMMSEDQQKQIQTVKRSKKRLLYQDLMAEQEEINHIKAINEEV